MSVPDPRAEPGSRVEDLHVVLVEPDIPWNTGNVGRTCVATGARLHLVRPLGFRLDQRHLRRAGLDYWQHVRPRVWDAWADCEAALPTLGDAWFFAAEGERSLWQVELDTPAVLVFGRESTGLPEPIRRRHRDRLVKIPMMGDPRHVRSLNLSTAAALAVYEVRRRQHAARDSVR